MNEQSELLGQSPPQGGGKMDTDSQSQQPPEGFRILRATMGPLSKSHVYNGKTLDTKTCFRLTHLLVSPNDHRPLAWPQQVPPGNDTAIPVSGKEAKSSSYISASSAPDPQPISLRQDET